MLAQATLVPPWKPLTKCIFSQIVLLDLRDQNLRLLHHGKVPPSISRDGAGPWNDEYWICHAACVFETPKKPKKITEDMCRNESTFHVYNCQCGDLYNARQRLGA